MEQCQLELLNFSHIQPLSVLWLAVWGWLLCLFYWLEEFNCFDMVSVHPLPKSLAFVQVDLMYLRAENSPNIKALKEVLLQRVLNKNG